MGEKIPDDIIVALTDDEVIKWAFNAQFERVCLSRYLRDNGVSLKSRNGVALNPEILLLDEPTANLILRHEKKL